MHLILSNNALSQLNVYLGFYSKPCFRYFEFETLLFFLGDLCMQYMNTCVALEKALEKVLTTDGNTLSLYCARCALYTTCLQYEAMLAINISLQMVYTRKGSV